MFQPRLQGARDVDAITSDEVSSGERYGAYLIGTILVVAGLFIVYIGL
ncbi:hypothetical protein [Haloarchaeobius sp. DFWS5]